MPTMRPRLAYTPLRQSVLRDLLTPRIPPMPQTGAEAHVLEALEALAWLAQNAKSEAARVSAANIASQINRAWDFWRMRAEGKL